jgi:hypothetical protein
MRSRHWARISLWEFSCTRCFLRAAQIHPTSHPRGASSVGGAIGENDYINWLKQGSLKRGGPRFETATIPAEESVVVVYRAITKYNAVYDDFSPQMLSYLSWPKVWWKRE